MRLIRTGSPSGVNRIIWNEKIRMHAPAGKAPRNSRAGLIFNKLTDLENQIALKGTTGWLARNMQGDYPQESRLPRCDFSGTRDLYVIDF